MVNQQADNLDSVVSTPSVKDQPVKEILTELFSNPSNTLNDIRELAQGNGSKILSAFGDVELIDPTAENKLSNSDKEKVVSDAMHKLSSPGSINQGAREGSDSAPDKDKPPTKAEKAARAWELMLEMTEKDLELEENVDQAAKAIKEGKFEDLAKLIKKLSKGDDDQFGKFQKRLSKQLGMDVDCRGDGSFNINFDSNFDPNARDKKYNYKTVSFDKDGKVTGAKETTAGNGPEKVVELDATKTFDALKNRIEEMKKSKK